MYHCGLFNLDEWDGDADYCVLDDIDAGYFPSWKSFMGAQKEFVLTDKYRRKKTVKWGKPTIWLQNPDTDMRRTLVRHMDWLRANVIFIDLEKPMF